MDYDEFVRAKRHSFADSGVAMDFSKYDFLFDYQIHAAELSARKGRFADFIDTGLGKTLIQLTLADSFLRHTNKSVLIITPLAVAFQFIKEAERFGINDVYHTKNGEVKKGIAVCNYERLDKYNPDDFGCVILDESSILKNFKGATKAAITSFMKRTPYRFLFTATPSPNDFIELGTSSEALGYLGYTDMLGKYFSNNEDTISPQKIGVKWVLKGHAEDDFFEWVSSWSLSMRKPSDLGFSDEKHILPELIIDKHIVHNNRPLCVANQFNMFAIPSTQLTEVREEQKETVTERCELAASKAAGKTSVYWCNLNSEGDLLADMDLEAVQIKGSMPLEKKEEILLAFSDGEIKRLITKPKITSFGLNWQHCNHTTFFPTFSYEQYYQAIRRFWRFGQKNPVTVDLVYSDGQDKVVQSIAAKAEKATQLFNKLNGKINQSRAEQNKFINSIQKPAFLGGSHD
jgi:hypothetical protein